MFLGMLPGNPIPESVRLWDGPTRGSVPVIAAQDERSDGDGGPAVGMWLGCCCGAPGVVTHSWDGCVVFLLLPIQLPRSPCGTAA